MSLLGRARGAAAALGLMALFAAAPPAAAQGPAGPSIHLGVASCASSTCHGATTKSPHSSVPQDEYLIWAKSDKHRLAYRVLLGARARRIAYNLGLRDAATAPLCLNCHADDVPPDRRGPQFRLSDGVGCEACHGGASNWLGVHISGATHQQNLAAGLYPTENPLARAKKCLSCHFGDPADPQRFVTHRIMGAGHPRMGFELDTYTYAEPAHFVVNKAYVARKGPVNDARIWAVGQAYSLLLHMQAVGVPAGMMQRAPELASDPHLTERRHFTSLRHPLLDGELVVERSSAVFASIPDPDDRPAPLAGQHTREIAIELLGLSEPEVDALLAAGVLEAQGGVA